MTDEAGRAAYLFVYGTLMTSAGGALGADMRSRLAAAGRSIGAATTAGRLVDLGDYPALIDAAEPSDTVHGEVIRLDEPEAALSWLNGYEGVSPIPAHDDEYVRVLATVRLACGDEILAWVYRYRGDASQRPRIDGGRWTR